MSVNGIQRTPLRELQETLKPRLHAGELRDMANDNKKKPSSALYCQKCRTPIDIDASIDQLNPAAFKLLTGMVAATANDRTYL